jgi:hypothetical protein
MGKGLKKKYHDADEIRKLEELGVSILGANVVLTALQWEITMRQRN